MSASRAICHALRALGLAAAALSCGGAPPRQAPVRVGSKGFTEGVVLGELASQLCASGGARVEHRRQLGGSVLLWSALRSGALDAYPEYTGTLAAELLHAPDARDLDDLARRLARQGLRMSRPLGFENTYALGVARSLARGRGLRTLSDLAGQRGLVYALTQEFYARADGFQGLRARYGLEPGEVRALEHALAYRAVGSGSAQVLDVYTTDAELDAHDLVALDDDRAYFPSYRAVLLYRADLTARAPGCVAAIERLEGRIDAAQMRAMNARVQSAGASEAQVAAGFLSTQLGVRAAPVREDTLAARVAQRTREHLALTLLAVLASALLGVPLGVLCARSARLRTITLGVAGVVQTVPSLALLVLLLPLFGIGAKPAVAALVLYGLFPVLEGTVTGLRGVPPPLRESAEALGLSPFARLWHLDLPMASPSILSGLRTSAVLCVGTATLGAMVGAGGYGQPILTGVRLDATSTILEGAVPAALLALLVQGTFRALERRLVPRGLRDTRES